MTMRIALSLGLFVIFISCRSTDNDTAAANREALSSAPLKSITDSIKRFPELPELRMRRALMLSQMNMHEKATPDYLKAYELTGDQHVLLDYASNLLLAQQLPEAIAALEEGMQKFPENGEFSRRLAEISMQQGNPDEALAQFDNMIAADSSNFEAWYEKGLLLARMKDTAKAIEALEKSFALVPINYSGLALANIYVAQKNPRALDICDILLERDSAKIQTEPLFMKGVFYADTKQYDEATAAFDECIRRDWKMTDAYIEKGIILYERKQFEEALKLFKMTITVSNTDADAYYWLGKTYEATGNVQDAIGNYERSVALDPTFTEARTALRRLGG